MNNNQIQKTNSSVSQMTTFLSSNAVKNKVNAIVGTKEGDKLISNLISNIQQNPTLAECSQGSIVNGALAGHALKLDFALQQAYLVPFNDNKTGTKNAQFCIGWKGYIQLALRSGQYRNINVAELKEGELKSFDRLTEKYEIEWIEDDFERENKETTHYIAYFELINGFRKVLIWTKKKMEIHAEKYSASYRADLKYNSKKSFWILDFDSQAKKTMIRQLISKYGVMSTEMTNALAQDMAVINDNGEPTYVDNVETTTEETKIYINERQIENLCQTIVKRELSVPDFLQQHNVDNVAHITLEQYEEFIKELSE